ncbi:MAG: glycine betaine ABC transporter substrate-binding protein [Thermoleophilaceae bacterium]
MGDGRRLATPAMAITAVALAGCGLGGGSDNGRRQPQRIAAGANHAELKVGAARSDEGRLLAQVYAQALKAAGYRARVVRGRAGADAWPASFGGSTDALRSRLARRGLQALPPARARLGQGVAVSRARARALDVEKLSQLERADDRVRLVAPRGCGREPACLPSLRRAYGLRRAFEVRPDLVQATLRAGRAGAAVVSRSDPHLARDDELLLHDDRHALPARALTLVATARAVRAAGPGLAAAARQAGSALSDAVLAELVARVTFDEVPPARAARGYLRAGRLLPPAAGR